MKNLYAYQTWALLLIALVLQPGSATSAETHVAFKQKIDERYFKPNSHRQMLLYKNQHWNMDAKKKAATEASAIWKIDRDIFFRLIETESSWRTHVKSKLKNDPALGIVQIRCSTAQYMGFTGRCSMLMHNPAVAMFYGAKYLRWLLDQDWVHQRYDWALASYFAGHGKMQAVAQGALNLEDDLRDSINHYVVAINIQPRRILAF